MASLLGDQSDGSSPLSGLLSWLPRPYDISAGYTGSLLKDPSTGKMDPDVQSAFRARALASVADAFAQGGMPVPYKGGIPLLSTIGHAAAAGYQGEDALMAARLQAAQGQLYGAQAGNQLAMAAANQAIMHGYANRPGHAPDDSTSSAPGTPASGGKPLTPMNLAAQGGGGQVSSQQLYSFLTDNGANKNEATAITSGMMAESGGNPNAEHDKEILAARGLPPGYGLFGDNGTNLTEMRKYAGVGPNDPVPWQQQALFALQSLRPGGIEAKAGAQINAAQNPEQLTDGQLAWLRPKDWNSGGGNRAQRLASTTDIFGNPPYAPTPQTAAATPGAVPQPPPTPTSLLDTSVRPPGSGPIPPTIPRNSRGEPYQPMTPGTSVAAGTPGAGPVITPQQAAAANAAARAAGGQQGLPVMPTNDIFGKGQVAPPGAGQITPAAPPQVSAAPPGLLNPQNTGNAPSAAGAPPAPPAPQSLLAPPDQGAPPLSPDAQAIVAGMGNAQGPGAQVAGPGAAGGPPAPGAIGTGPKIGMPPNLLQQPPGPQTPPPATPAPPAPQAAPAPPSAAPVAPPPAPPPVAPPPSAALPPPQPLAMPPGQQKFSNEEIAWAKQMAAAFTVSGRQVPPDIAALSTLDTDMAKEAQKQMLDNYYKQQQAIQQAGIQRAQTVFEQPYKVGVAQAGQAERGAQARETYANEVVNIPGLGWIQRKNIPGFTLSSTDALTPKMPGVNTPPGTLPGTPTPGGPVLFPSATPAQEEIFKKNLDDATKQLDTYHVDQNSAPMQIANAQSITDLLAKTQTGWGTDAKQEAGKIMYALGVPQDSVNHFMGLNIAAGDELKKLFLQYSADAVRAMGAREPGSVISMFAGAYPSLETQPDAARLMTNALAMQAQWKLDRANAADAWALNQQRNAGRFGENYQGMIGFNQAFQATNDPRNYWRAANAMSGHGDLGWNGTNDAQKAQVYRAILPGQWYLGPDGQGHIKPAAGGPPGQP